VTWRHEGAPERVATFLARPAAPCHDPRLNQHPEEERMAAQRDESKAGPWIERIGPEEAEGDRGGGLCG